MMNKTKRILSILLILQMITIQSLNSNSEFIENYYSKGIYPFISSLFRYFFGWIPFSAGDLFYSLIFLMVLRSVFIFIKNKKRNYGSLLLSAGAFFSVIYFLFYFLWGLNYFREPVERSMDLAKNEYNQETLKKLTDKLFFNLVKTHKLLTANDSLKVTISQSKNELITQTQNGYSELKKIFPQFSYKPVSLKKSMYSLPLTYMGFSGYLNPFSGEAQVDYLVPKVSLPIISSHEVAHQLGIASESEANFIGFLAAVHNDDPVFQYSAYLMAYRYALYDLSKSDRSISKKYMEKTPKGILENIKEIDRFWQQYQNASEKYFKIFYDNYLKINQQKHGIQSYSKMIDLLIAYDKKYPL
ncbi:MAG: DUF3810 domain-containing protein [Flavobacteriia bacterium]|nr:MAG: DUF3810 domain-containing protein [Flavobacteriia bacterium]